jgi:hypothetical protein
VRTVGRAIGVSVAAITLIAGCSGPSEATTADSIASAGARLHADGVSVWAVSSDRLFRLSSAEAEAVHLDPPLPLGDAGFEARGENLSLAHVVEGSRVQVSRSQDGGRTWTTSDLVDVPTIDGIRDGSISTNGTTIAVLANENGSANVAIGKVALSSDGGLTWHVANAPTGGSIAFAGGSHWLVGGPMGDQVFSSHSGTSWSGRPPPVRGAVWSALPPFAVEDQAILVTTTHTDGDSNVTFWTTRDNGATWTELRTVTTLGTESRVSVPTGVAQNGSWMVAWPDGSMVVTGTFDHLSEPVTVDPTGLPESVVELALRNDGSAVALGGETACPQGKPSCRTTYQLFNSLDGGRTWSPVP